MEFNCSVLKIVMIVVGYGSMEGASEDSGHNDIQMPRREGAQSGIYLKAAVGKNYILTNSQR